MFSSNPGLIEEAFSAWKRHAALRTTRRGLMRHTYGDQWSDLTQTSSGQTVSEYEKARMAGMRPLTNNLLRALVKSVVGRFRYNISQSGEPPSAQLLDVYRSNLLDELDSRALEEFLISGTAIQRVVYENRPPDGAGVWIDNVNPEHFFCTPFRDPRGSDIRLIGMLHDMTLDELRLRFGHNSRRRHRYLEKIYRHVSADGPYLSSVAWGGHDSADTKFYSSSPPGFCRVIEVWTYDIDPHHPVEDPHWHCRFLTPDGSVIDHSRSPLKSGAHPFALKFYPLTDGAVHPFIEDLVGQQKHINTLITTIDHILANSAKGVLLMPTDAVPPGLDMEKVADIWSHPGGVIPVNPTARRLPVEVTAAGRSEGAARLLEMEMQMFQQISGVTSALQGIAPGANVSASLYESQVYNSAIALLDVYESFNSFRTMRDRIALALLS
ncbi:PAS domain-containing protein [Duncaniella dubosii]|uniref:PAS domain-containing protein n=1 Tax=Duncaniella dubosii TaxID=2518971 RepID=UPI0025A9ED53|nr:hypothetical protein [uncultured Duncaniella sp.]